MMDEAVNEGNQEAKPILEKGEVEARNILEVSEDKINSAVKLVVERIVNIHGNS